MHIVRHAGGRCVRRATRRVGAASAASSAECERGAPMTRVRPAAVAGTFYPDHPATLAAMVDGFVRDAGPPPSADAPPVAVIAPHAGYVYSG
ncbi:MAG TPA: AmmeMemoRadiSam system protein B, partial [Acidimicrobiaceae bacterium]|nr:AmmeMemoRadiSam system protein B [Acidimicrobiaceae bacterium]